VQQRSFCDGLGSDSVRCDHNLCDGRRLRLFIDRTKERGTVVRSAPAKISLAAGGMSYHVQNYIVAGDTKYEIMRDTKKVDVRASPG